MKKHYLICSLSSIYFLLFLILPSGTLAQDSLNVIEIRQEMSKGNQNSFQVLIPRERDNRVLKDWKKLLKKETGTRIVRSGSEWYGSGAVLPSMSRDTFSVYSVIERVNSKTRLTVYFMKSDSSFVDSEKDAAAAASIRLLVRNFSVDQYKRSVDRKLKEEKDVLKKLEGDVRALEKENDRYENKIAKNRRDIGRLETEIRNQEVLEQQKGAEILSQQQLLGSFLSSTDLKEQEEKKLKALEKERKKMIRRIESNHKKINKLEEDIRNLEKDIKKNKNDRIPDKQKEIKVQERVIHDIEDLLNSIR